jgi:hypothetical protein
MRFLKLTSGAQVNADAVEAVMVGEGMMGEWPVMVYTAGREYVDCNAKSADAATEAVALIVADLTGTKHVKIGTAVPCANCSTPIVWTALDGVGWVHVLSHSHADRKGCVNAQPTVEPDAMDDELAGLLSAPKVCIPPHACSNPKECEWC